MFPNACSLCCATGCTVLTNESFTFLACTRELTQRCRRCTCLPQVRHACSLCMQNEKLVRLHHFRLLGTAVNINCCSYHTV